MGLAERDYMPNPYDWDEPRPASRSAVRQSSGSALSGRGLALVVALMIFGALVLPHLTIAGRHWHLWVLP